MNITGYHCVKKFDTHFFGGEKNHKGSIDSSLTQELRIWWETFFEYYFVHWNFEIGASNLKQKYFFR